MRSTKLPSMLVQLAVEIPAYVYGLVAFVILLSGLVIVTNLGNSRPHS